MPDVAKCTAQIVAITIDYPGFIGWDKLESWHTIAPPLLDGGGTGANGSIRPHRFLLPVLVRIQGEAGLEPAVGAHVRVTVLEQSGINVLAIGAPEDLVAVTHPNKGLETVRFTDSTGTATFALSTPGRPGTASVAITVTYRGQTERVTHRTLVD